MKNPSTYSLVRALKAGDLDSLEKVYKAYYPKLYGFSRKFNSNTLEPDDFVQQTFLKLWEKRDQLKEDILLDKQIFIICRNLIINNLKREAKTVAQIEKKYLPEEDEVEDLAKKNGELRKIYSIIQKLPAKRKNIFLLHKINNLTYEEIAESLGISKKTIANHIYLAHNFIKEEAHKS